jgi:hypothetical protein
VRLDVRCGWCRRRKSPYNAASLGPLSGSVQHRKALESLLPRLLGHCSAGPTGRAVGAHVLSDLLANSGGSRMYVLHHVSGTAVGKKFLGRRGTFSQILAALARDSAVRCLHGFDRRRDAMSDVRLAARIKVLILLEIPALPARAIPLHALDGALCVVDRILDTQLAQGCRLLQRSKVGSSLRYSGRAANVAAKAAHDPKATFTCTLHPHGIRMMRA